MTAGFNLGATGAVLAAIALLLSGCGDEQTPAAPQATVTTTVTATPDPDDATTSADAGPADQPDAGSGDPIEPATYADAVALLEAAELTERPLGAFQTPSGNIHCTLDDGGFLGACEVLEGRIVPWDADAVCGGSPERTIGRLEIADDEVYEVCNTDTIANPDAPVLEYGAVARTDGFVTCVSEEFGITCVNTDARVGFFLARGTYTTFFDR